MRKTILAVVIISLIGMFNVVSGMGKQKNYMVVFDVKDYTSQIKDSVNHFFTKVLGKKDQLIIITPARVVGYSPKKLQQPRKKLANDLVKLLKSDISTKSGQHRTIMRDMLTSVQDLTSGNSLNSGGYKTIMQNYQKSREMLTQLRGDIEAKLLGYGKIFRKVRGENHLIYILQQESRPIPDKKSMSDLQSNPTTTGFLANETFLVESFKKKIDYKKIVAQFKYGNVRFHFLYLQSKKFKARRGVQYVDNLGELYSIFSKISKETNGLKVSSAKPEAFVKKVGQIAEGKVEVEVVDEKMD